MGCNNLVYGDVAVAGAYVGALGGPLGVAVGVGVVSTYLVGELKIMDVDNDGEKNSVGDAIKIGTKGLIDNVSSWFK